MQNPAFMQKIQQILLYSQIADTYIKLFLNICLVIAVIYFIRYINQKRKIEKETHERRMKDAEAKAYLDRAVSQSIEEKMENMDA